MNGSKVSLRSTTPWKRDSMEWNRSSLMVADLSSPMAILHQASSCLEDEIAR